MFMKTTTTPSRPESRATRARSRKTILGRGEPSTKGVPAAGRSSLQIEFILVPTDFSEPSKKALDYAVRLAEQFGAKLALLHVVEPIPAPDFANAFPLMMENDKVKAACKAQLERLVKQKAIRPDLVEKTLVRQGRSFHEIADAARTLKADLIVISTHGYTGLKHAMLGSTTERVVRHAPCPVLVVRAGEQEFVRST